MAYMVEVDSQHFHTPFNSVEDAVELHKLALLIEVLETIHFKCWKSNLVPSSEVVGDSKAGLVASSFIRDTTCQVDCF